MSLVSLGKIQLVNLETFSPFSAKWPWGEWQIQSSKCLEMTILHGENPDVLAIPYHSIIDYLHNFDSDGTCVRDYIHILDLAGGHLVALEALSDENVERTFGNAAVPNQHFKAYNLGKGRGQSVLEIAEAMTKASGHKFQMEIVGRRCVFVAQYPMTHCAICSCSS